MIYPSTANDKWLENPFNSLNIWMEFVLKCTQLKFGLNFLSLDLSQEREEEKIRGSNQINWTQIELISNKVFCYVCLLVIGTCYIHQIHINKHALTDKLVSIVSFIAASFLPFFFLLSFSCNNSLQSTHRRTHIQSACLFKLKSSIY